jgi:predicted aminopeptidase
VKGDWPAFFAAVETLGRLPAEERKAALIRLQDTVALAPAPASGL